MRYPFHLADVFTRQIFGGNPLAVLPQADGLDERQMRAIAREFNFSETVFVFPPRDPAHAARLRIFTPGMELPFAGHPTVGTAHILAATGRISLQGETTRAILEEEVGPVPVFVHARAGRPEFVQFTAARLPEFGPQPPSNGALARMLSLAESDLLSDQDRPASVSCGVPFVLIPLRSLEAVRRAQLDVTCWAETLASAWAPHVYVFCDETETKEAQVHARMFAPAMGIQEDPATGAAATALAGYLAARAPAGNSTLRWTVEQGLELGRPSLIQVEADREAGRVSAVRVGGGTVLVGEGMLDLP